MNTCRKIRTRRGTSRVLLAALACLPCGLAVVAHAIGPSAHPVARAAAVRPLAFDQYLVNLGPSSVGERFVHARFSFTNTGSKPLRVLGLEPSCSCIHPRFAQEQDVYQPGERGEFSVVLEATKELPGPKTYSINVPYRVDGNDESSPADAVDVLFKVILPEPQVAFRPKGFFFYQLDGRPTKQTATLVDTRENPLTVTGVQSSSDLVTADFVNANTDDDGVRTYTVEVNVAGDVPPEKTHAVVKVMTDDPAYRILRLPLLIIGPDANPFKHAGQPGTSETQRR